MITSVLFDGDLGAGKTLSALSLAYHWSQIGGIPLLSNMNIVGAEKIDTEQDWVKIARYKDEGSIVLLDEAQAVLDSRTSMTKGQVKFTELLMYLRKMKCIIIFTTPSITMVDIRVRQRLSAWIHVSRIQDFIVWDIFDGYTSDFKNSKVIKQKTIEKFYPLYDTLEMISPIALPTDLKDFLAG